MNDEALIVTDNAAKKVYELLTEEGNPQLSLRVSITGGGCSGFQYAFIFDENFDPENDTVIEKSIQQDNSAAEQNDEKRIDKQHVVRLVVDPVSLQYLRGAIIDYREDVGGAQFVITNPHAQTTCGCGSSFSV